MDSQSRFHDIDDYSPIGVEALDVNANMQPMNQLEFGSFFNSEVPTSFAPDFMDNDMTMPSSVDTAMSTLEVPSFEFDMGGTTAFQQPVCGGLELRSADSYDSFQVRSAQHNAASSIPVSYYYKWYLAVE